MVLRAIKNYAAILFGLIAVVALLSIQYLFAKTPSVQGFNSTNKSLATAESCTTPDMHANDEIYFVSCGGLF